MFRLCYNISRADETQGRNGREFLNEIDLMKKIGYHKNVLSILGCCTIHDPVCLVVEHAPLGDLLSYLQKKRRSLQSVGSSLFSKLE